MVHKVATPSGSHSKSFNKTKSSANMLIKTLSTDFIGPVHINYEGQTFGLAESTQSFKLTAFSAPCMQHSNYVCYTADSNSSVCVCACTCYISIGLSLCEHQNTTEKRIGSVTVRAITGSCQGLLCCIYSSVHAVSYFLVELFIAAVVTCSSVTL